MNRIVIIGAGASGLAAASRLVSKGVSPKQLMIIEAQDRIGGRIHTVSKDGHAFEMGANWVHGEKGNVVYEIAAAAGELNTDVHTLQSSSMGDDVVFAFENSTTTSHQRQEMFQLMESIIDQGEKDLVNWPASFGEYITTKFMEKLDEGALTCVDRATALSFLEWYHRLQAAIDGSDDWMETCGSGHLQYRECPGDPLVTWKRGYSVIFDILTRDIPKCRNGLELPLTDRIQLNKAVERIKWTGTNQMDPVRVYCQDGTIYEADYVLITCSLGFLKENADRVFEPLLPLQKRKAIEGLGFGTVNKIFLRFSAPWWSSDWGGISFLVRQDGHTPSDDWSEKIQGFYTVRNQPDMLLGWISGAPARTAESLPEDQVLRICSDRLRSYVGSHFPYTEPVELIRSTWHSNPFTRGSYSYRSVKSKELNVWASDLAEPVRDSNGLQRLFFAGEATHDHFYSTVHGAIETGWREADRIVQCLKPHLSATRL